METMISLVLGGARSGKSKFGEDFALSLKLDPVYIATCEARDGEMHARITHHRKRRDAAWRTLEVPLDLAQTVIRETSPDRVLLIDCLTLWLSNLMEADLAPGEACRELCMALKEAAGPVVLISNEVGQGIVPENALARRFRDEAGWLNQEVAACATDVSFIVAGICLPLKRNGKTIDQKTKE